jgi:hypothetical protein
VGVPTKVRPRRAPTLADLEHSQLAQRYAWKPPVALGSRPVFLRSTNGSVAPEPAVRARHTAIKNPQPSSPVTLDAAAAALRISPTMLRDWLLEGAPVLDLAAIVAWRSAQTAHGAQERSRKRGMSPQFDGVRGFLSRPVVR